ncbi:MAG: minor capsid protein [Bacilli bacterium]
MTGAGEDLVAYLANLGGIGTPGVNLFLGHMPDLAAAITIIETGGPAPYHTYGPEEIIDHPSVQVLVRNPAYLLARDKADQIRDALDGLTGMPINGTRYLSITAMSDPAHLGKTGTSQGEAHEFSVNFTTMRERAAPVVGLCGAYYDLSEWFTP